jgi:two-component system, NarL family, sensor kinase
MSEERARVPATPAGRTTSLVATALAAAIGGAAIGIVIGLRLANEDHTPDWEKWWIIAWLVIGVIDVVIGAALVTRYGHRRLGGCLIATGGAGLMVAVSTQARYSTLDDPESGWAMLTGAKDWAHPVAIGVLAALLPWELTRNGRHTLTEVIWWATAVMIAVVAVAKAADLGHPAIDAVYLIALSATLATLRAIYLWWTRRAIQDDPLPTLVAAGALAAWLAVVPKQVGFGVDLPGGDAAGALVLLATVPLLVVAAIVNALRDRPGRFHGVAHDVISWLLLYGAILVVYTGVVGGISVMLGGEPPVASLFVTTAIIAVLADPVRRRITRASDRLVWGARDDPLEVVRGVVEQVGADSGDELLPALAASLQRDLRLDFVAIDVSDPNTPDGWRREAELGPETTYMRTVELDQHGEVVGRLVVGWEYGPLLRGRDEHVLTELVGPLGLAVGWVRLAADLRRSSVAVVSAREEERRRLRRDLHDGLGPALYGVSMGLRTALRQIERSDGDDALLPSRQLLERLADEVDSMSSEVKRIVRALVPTALDQLGLVGALTQFARTFDDEIEIDVSLPTDRIELPAAVEIATYRIVTEAMTNVLRHARAARCWLSITTGEMVDIDIRDDGVGLNGHLHDGVGLQAIKERAEELGGSFEVRPNQPHGTHIHACLPAVLP